MFRIVAAKGLFDARREGWVQKVDIQLQESEGVSERAKKTPVLP